MRDEGAERRQNISIEMLAHPGRQPWALVVLGNLGACAFQQAAVSNA